MIFRGFCDCTSDNFDPSKDTLEEVLFGIDNLVTAEAKTYPKYKGLEMELYIFNLQLNWLLGFSGHSVLTIKVSLQLLK